MKKILPILIFVSSLYAAEDNWPYDDAYDDNMLYLHALINYDYNALWKFRWEEKQFSSNGFRITVGSVTTTDLLTDWGLFINQDLGAGWRFQGIGRWNETRHKNIFEKSALMGLEKEIYQGLNIHLLVNPSYYKENTDLNAGFTYYDQSREFYARIALQYEDFVYDSKNDQAGISSQKPLGLTWNVRTGKSKFFVYSEGRISTGFKRDFPDMEKSPDERSHDQRRSQVRLNLYYRPDELSIAVFRIHYYQFDEEKSFTEKTYNYKYMNQFSDVSTEYMHRLDRQHQLRVLAYYISQFAEGYGYQGHKFNRSDIMFGAFYEYFLGSHSLELGYMFTIADYEYEGMGYRPDFNHQGYVDKVMLGWLYAFPNDAQINISLSHQLTIGGFGGANLKYIMFF
jgi:hypothetical protein